MHAVLLTGHGGPEKLIHVTDAPVPDCASDEVLLEITACGLNNTDIWVREGAYGTDDDPGAISTWRRGRSTLVFPRIQGADIVGRIVRTGAKIASSRIGERVLVDGSIYNRNDDSLADIDYIGHGRDGGYAEYVAVPAEQAHCIRTKMTDAELATFWCAYHTGEQMLERASLQAGERVLITGASGGVGSGLIQLSRARGAIPYAVVSEGKQDAVRKIGAEAVIIRGRGDFRQEVEKATRGAPIDVVADLVAGPLFGTLLNMLRPEGRYTTAGAIAGPVVTLDLRTIYLKQLQLNGSSQGTRAAFRRVIDLIEADRLRPLLAKTYPLSRIHDAQAYFMAKKFVGKIVIIPDSKYAPFAEASHSA
ncbi:MAG: alcohol dehydrogenase family protein [Acidisphaera sp.]|nr:alcohol dehydrogenase family protein [Acidisphaera sp.]